MLTKNKYVNFNIIGLCLKVINSTNSSLIGLEGKILDETKNIILINDNYDTTKKIPKANCIFEINLKEKIFVVNGEKLVGRLERRLTNK